MNGQNTVLLEQHQNFDASGVSRYIYIYISHMLHVLKGQFIGYDALLKDNFHAPALETAKANHGHRLSQQSRHS